MIIESSVCVPMSLQIYQDERCWRAATAVSVAASALALNTPPPCRPKLQPEKHLTDDTSDSVGKQAPLSTITLSVETHVGTNMKLGP